MNWLDFISSLVSSVAWPVAFVIAALVFRQPLRELMKRMTDVEVFGNKATFQSEFKKAEEAADRVTRLPPPKDEPKRKRRAQITARDYRSAATAPPATDAYLTLANAHPAAAVIEAYKKVEAVLNNWQDAQGMTHPPSNEMLIKWLAVDGLLSKDTQELYDRVRRTRNIAVHAPSEKITVGEAIAFGDLCSKLAVYLEDALREYEKIRATRTQAVIPRTRKVARATVRPK